MAILKFKNVQKSFKDTQALKDITFEVKKGEFFALLGPNGAGKTTLINCLAGIAKRTGGTIAVMGQDPEQNPEFTKLKLGIVEQELVYDPFFTPLEILKLRRGLFGIKPNDKYLEWLLEKLSLLDKKDAETAKLSGGMKRRLMIAKALAHEPEILILDEPTAGVDIKLRQDLWEFMKELQSTKNLTILLTTHYLEEAEELAERVAIQNAGEIIVCENTKKLLSKKARILEIEKQDGTYESFELKTNENIHNKIKHCENIKDIKIREPKLEEIFLEFTKP